LEITVSIDPGGGGPSALCCGTPIWSQRIACCASRSPVACGWATRSARGSTLLARSRVSRRWRRWGRLSNPPPFWPGIGS